METKLKKFGGDMEQQMNVARSQIGNIGDSIGNLGGSIENALQQQVGNIENAWQHQFGGNMDQHLSNINNKINTHFGHIGNNFDNFGSSLISQFDRSFRYKLYSLLNVDLVCSSVTISMMFLECLEDKVLLGGRKKMCV